MHEFYISKCICKCVCLYSSFTSVFIVFCCYAYWCVCVHRGESDVKFAFVHYALTVFAVNVARVCAYNIWLTLFSSAQARGPRGAPPINVCGVCMCMCVRVCLFCLRVMTHSLFLHTSTCPSRRSAHEPPPNGFV